MKSLIPRGCDRTLERYLADIRGTIRIDRQEEVRLLEQCREGSKPARDRLLLSHMRFVAKVALHYRNGPLPVPDLISEGAFGLLRAIESYEAHRGIKFISYAVWWIRCYIVRALESKGALIRLPAHEHVRLRKMKRFQAGPGEDSLQYVRVSKSFSEGSHAAWRDAGPRLDEELASQEAAFAIRKILSGLQIQENYVIRNLYGIDQEEAENQRVVAEELGISVQRVCQIKDKALDKMRSQALSLDALMLSP